MATEFNTGFYRKVFALTAVALVAFALYQVLQPFWGALAWSSFLAFLVYPLHVRLTNRLKGRAGVSAGIMTALVPVFVVAPLAMLGVVFANQVRALIQVVQRGGLKFDATLLTQLEQYPIVGRVTKFISDNVPVTMEQVQAWLVDSAQGVLKGVAATGGNIVLGAVGTVVSFFLMLFLFFFILRDGRDMFAAAVKLIPLTAERRDHLFAHLGRVTRGVVYGTGLTAILQGTLVGLGFAFIGLPSPVVFGVLAGVLALLPAGGTAIVWGPAVAYLAFAQRWGAAIFLLIWGVLVSISDNFLRPMLISKTAPVSTLVVFVGVVGGVSAFGTIGLVIGPVFLTLVAALMQYAHEMLDAESPPTIAAEATPPAVAAPPSGGGNSPPTA
jgi:predicted PurR-regulated permease PerM